MHGFDDQGSKFDAKGNIATGGPRPTARTSRRARAKLVKQFDDYVAIDGLHVNGKLTLGENIADLGGLHGRLRRAPDDLAGREAARRSTA